MKVFFAIFAAILAAAVVIVLGLYGWARIVQWERAKQICHAQISSELDAMTARTSQNQADLHDLAQRAQDSRDVLEVGRRGLATLHALEDGQNRSLEAERTLVTLLQNKPFALPLTAAERRELDSARAEVQQGAKGK